MKSSITNASRSGMIIGLTRFHVSLKNIYKHIKKAKLILSFSLLVVLMNSCVYSLFPIYTEDTLVYFPELIGRWEIEGESGDYIEFGLIKKSFGWLSDGTSEDESTASSNDKSYQVVSMEDGDKQVFVGHIAEIGDDFFLDLYPAERYSEGNSESNMMPVHTFIKLNYINNQLYLTSFDLEKLNKLFESNLIRLRHENVDGTILITAQPKEIQKFLDRYSDDESVFEETAVYKRAS
ncbi:hypothetical protein [Algoriphagus marinus]|uniref:hypothetical protein n=1 Tax=Algoriphagus marinus TaxID=1925762 RepID=UPI000B21F306|nr:hypothetical protein [Algoriphagus marinus]